MSASCERQFLMRTAIFEIVQILSNIFHVVTATLPDQTATLPDHMERYVFRCFLKKDFSYTIINNYHLRLLGQRQGKCRRHRMRKEQGKGFFAGSPLLSIWCSTMLSITKEIHCISSMSPKNLTSLV